MTLTLSDGPLSLRSAPTNYTIDGPAHRVLVHDVDRRIRVEVGGAVVVDTTAAKMLHESNLLPVYYVPVADLVTEHLVDSDTTTHCPFKGDASYWTVQVGDRTEDDLVWAYREPNAELAVIDGYAGIDLARVDRVLEEDEEIVGHPRDPYHRVDVRRSDRHVVVRHGDAVIADTTAPLGVFETGLPARWYLPRADVATDRLVASDTVTTCPYKGVSRYWSLDGGPADVAWSYDEPLDGASALADHVCLLHDELDVEVTPG